MTPVKIMCVSCGQGWNVASTFSLYEQQAVESCPCPECGAYTLCFREPFEEPAFPRVYRPASRRAEPVHS